MGNDITYNGYGRLFLKNEKIDGRWVARKTTAHRYSWKLHYGPIPDDLLVLHKCDVRLCVRPDHLFIGTAKDNMQDAVRKRRNAYGERSGRSILNETAVREILSSVETGVALAEKYGVDGRTISEVRTRKTWLHLI